MKRLLLLAGLLGAGAVAVARLFRLGEGTIRSTAGRAAEVVREKGPAVTASVAQGIEEVGEVAEKGAQEVRQRVSGSGEEEDKEEPSEAEEPPR